MRFSITSFLLLAAFTCSAQIVLELQYDQEPRSISLRFAVADVVDVRMDTVSIGLVKVGALNRLEAARLKYGCSASIRKYINRIFPQPGTAPRVAMVIHDLRISEAMSMAHETARLHVKYEFYDVDDKDMPLIFTFSRIYEEQGFDVTSKHEGNIRRSVREALMELTLAFDKESLSRPSENNNRVLSNSYPIADAVRPARGIYRSFEEFRSNTPSDRAFDVRKKSHKARQWLGSLEIEPYYTGVNGQAESIEESAWGFSDGEKIYIQQGHEYFELTRNANSWTFYSYGLEFQPIGVVGRIGNTPTKHYQLDMNTGLVFQIGQ